jgi:putative inorganic carbon (HCO3(-)) transporter
MPVFYPAFLVDPKIDVAHAHNQLLQAAVDLGLPGLIAYLALWIGAAHMLHDRSASVTEHSLNSVAGALGAALVAQFVFGLADAIALGAKVGWFFWLTLGLIASLQRITRLGLGLAPTAPVASLAPPTNRK